MGIYGLTKIPISSYKLLTVSCTRNKSWRLGCFPPLSLGGSAKFWHPWPGPRYRQGSCSGSQVWHPCHTLGHSAPPRLLKISNIWKNMYIYIQETTQKSATNKNQPTRTGKEQIVEIFCTQDQSIPRQAARSPALGR